jgi:hypothetical protein
VNPSIWEEVTVAVPLLAAVELPLLATEKFNKRAFDGPDSLVILPVSTVLFVKLTQTADPGFTVTVAVLPPSVKGSICS